MAQVQGGGGSGGGAGATAGGKGSGGGAGGYVEVPIDFSALAASETVTVGAGGGGAGGQTVGNAGGDSSFGAFATGQGGGGGPITAGHGAAGGGGGGPATSSVADAILIRGQNGNQCWSVASPLAGSSGNGGDSQLGTGGQARVSTTANTSAGENGSGFGGGGSGALNMGGGNNTSGAGSPGIVIVDVYGTVATPSGGAPVPTPHARIRAGANFVVGSGWAYYNPTSWVIEQQNGNITVNNTGASQFANIQINVPGYYLVRSQSGWGVGAGTIARIGTNVTRGQTANSNAQLVNSIDVTNSASGLLVQTAGVFYLNAGDFIQAQTYHDSATGQTVTNAVLEVTAVALDQFVLAGITPNLKVTPRIFTANGTWTKPPGLVSLLVEVVGGGGGGGGGAPSAGSRGSGGGAGGYARVLLSAADLAADATVAVTVGSGSGGGGSGTNGGAGAASSFGSYAVGNGGAGGTGGTGPGAAQGGVGGTATSPIATALLVGGQVGGAGFGSTSPLMVQGGGGGNTPLGMGGPIRAVTSGSSLAGLAGSGPGGGGSGSACGTATGAGGGAGADGVVLLTEYTA